MVAPLALFLASLAGGHVLEGQGRKRRGETQKQDQANVRNMLDYGMNPDMASSNGIDLDVSMLGPMSARKRMPGLPGQMNTEEYNSPTRLTPSAMNAPKLNQQDRQRGFLDAMTRMQGPMKPGQAMAADMAGSKLFAPPKAPGPGYTLGENQVRFNGAGEEVARGPRKTETPKEPNRKPIYNKRGDFLGNYDASLPNVSARLDAGDYFIGPTYSPESDADTPAPTTPLAKLNFDLENGHITPKQHAAAVAALDAEAEGEKESTLRDQRADKAAFDGADLGFTQLIDAATAIREDKDLGRIAGGYDARTPDIFPAARRLRAKLETLQSKIALQAMQAARQGSASGATGFGALSAPELNILQTSVAALDPAAGVDVLKEQLQEIIDYGTNLRKNLRNSYSKVYSQPNESPKSFQVNGYTIEEVGG